MRGLPDEDTREGVSPTADVEKLVVEGRYGQADLALRRLEALIPSLAQTADGDTLLLALYGRALLLRQLNAGTQNAIAACDVLERAAHERESELWVATGCATRARFRIDSGDIGGATADLARADAEAATGDLSTDTGYRLLDGLALVYAGLRLHDRADEVRARIEQTVQHRRVLDQAQHWSTWSGELAARAMEPLAGGAQDPQQEMMGRAVQIAAKLDDLPDAEVPSTLRRGARGVRALSAAYRGRPSEALRLLGPDAFGTVGDLPVVERQIVSLAAMRAHALVGSLATARSLDDAATTAPATLPNLVLEVCRTRERLWLETYAGGDVIPVLHRMTELLVRLGWRGMDLVADTARQALEHQALRTESRTDALTGVGNRRALDEELRQLLRFGPLPLALILVDIDHFKEVNDVFTHVVGDEVLRRVAASLSLQLRTDDQLLRYGGDEFVVLLPGTGDEEADAVAERMAAAVAARPWSELADGLNVSITTGVAAVWSLSGRRPDADAERLFRRADERLLEGKRNRPEESRGRGRGRSGATGPADGELADVGLHLTDDELDPGSDGLDLGYDEKLEDDDRPGDRFRTAAALGVDADLRVGADYDDLDLDLDDDLDLNDEDDVLSPVRSLGLAPDHAPEPAAIRPPERRPRSAFDPAPEDDEFDTAPRRSPAPVHEARTQILDVIGNRHGATFLNGSTPTGSAPTGSASDGSALPETPIRSRRSARDRPDPRHDSLSSAGRDAAESAAAAREVARATAEEARVRAAQETRAREDAARQAEILARAEKEKAAQEAADRAQAEREAAAREVREKAAREAEAAERRAREKVAQERAVREAAEAAAREAERAEQERASRERERRERQKLEAERRERERVEAEKRERERVEAERRERARVESEKRERERAEAEKRERERIEAERELARVEAERREQERVEAERREQERVEAERRELERVEAERREQERIEAERLEAERIRAEKRERERIEAERVARERREAERREMARQEAERRELARQEAVRRERERIEAERRDAERRESERREHERLELVRRERERAEAERREIERRERDRREQERLAREQREREAAALEARRQQEAHARAEAEARARAAVQARIDEEARAAAVAAARARAEAEVERARASEQIRNEAYARAAEQARLATGSFPISRSVDPVGRSAEPRDAWPPANRSTADRSIGESQPLQRRAALYDASRDDAGPDDTPFGEARRERRSHPRTTDSVPPAAARGAASFRPDDDAKADPAPVEEAPAAPRIRREPFGPGTRSQAIIDLSARKRPRSPYSG